MKVLIFGATGGTGRQLVERSLEDGNSTSVFVHDSPQRLTKYIGKITVFQGDVLDFEAVDRAVKGHDAVVVALGVIPGRSKHVLSMGTSNIIRSMKSHDVKRLIVETGAGIVENQSQIPLIWKLTSNMPFMRGMFQDKREQEKRIKNSNLEWVIVRPANLTNGALTTNYHVGETYKMKTSSTISRADVADFMMKQIKSPEWVGKAVLLESAKPAH